MIIAIDGPAGAGKGTLGRRLAKHFSIAYLDTGRLYRAVAARVLQEGLDPEDPVACGRVARAIRATDLANGGEVSDLRSEALGRVTAEIATHREVRDALFEFQRRFARNPPGGAKGAVLDGRDIGTVICPEPDVIKFYVHASPEARAERRFKELQARGDSATYAAVLQDMKDRDARDANRGVSAMKKADDAYDLDTTGLTPDQVFQKALAHIQSRNRAGG